MKQQQHTIDNNNDNNKKVYNVIPNDNKMYVQKRSGYYEEVSFDKILSRLELISDELNVNYTKIGMKTVDSLTNGITTSELDEIAAREAVNMSIIHPDYEILASRIMISNHHKNTLETFADVEFELYHNKDRNGKHSPIIRKDIYELIQEHEEELEEAIDYNRDYLIGFFGYMTLNRSYLARTTDRSIIERPQHMWMRVSIEIHGHNIEKVIETYDYLSQKYFTHATPTLFNAGTLRPQLSSCYLLGMDDSLESIYKVLTDCTS